MHGKLVQFLEQVVQRITVRIQSKNAPTQNESEEFKEFL